MAQQVVGSFATDPIEEDQVLDLGWLQANPQARAEGREKPFQNLERIGDVSRGACGNPNRSEDLDPVCLGYQPSEVRPARDRRLAVSPLASRHGIHTGMCRGWPSLSLIPLGNCRGTTDRDHPTVAIL